MIFPRQTWDVITRAESIAVEATVKWHDKIKNPIITTMDLCMLLVGILLQLACANPGPSPDPDSPDFADELSLSALNLSASNTSVTTDPLPLDIKCSGSHFGWRPSLSDCQSAKEYIAPDSTRYPWGQRKMGLGDNVFPLPYRVMGGELYYLLGQQTDRVSMTDRALCFFQPVIVGGRVRVAYASLQNIRTAANSLILQCAAGENPQGGIASNIGKPQASD